MTNREYYADRPAELAEVINMMFERMPEFGGKSIGETVAEFLDAECVCTAQAEGETTFVVTLQAVNTIRGTIEDVRKTAGELERLYHQTAKRALTGIFGDARDADDVSLRGVQVFPSNLKTD